MTISSLTNRVSYPGAGSVGPFTVNFRVFAIADVLVTKRRTSDVDTTLVYGVDYTIEGINNSAFSVTLTAALAVGELLVIRRAPPLTQPTSIQNQGSYFPKTHEDEFDRLVMQMQSLQDQVDRAFRLRESSGPAGLSLTLKPEAGKVLAWQSATELGNSPLDSSAVAVPGGGRTVATASSYLLNNAVYNVKDYGALGDGAANDRAAIQLAIDSAPDGATIFFPATTAHYRVASTLNVTGRHRLTFLGQSWGAQVKPSATGFNVFTIDTTSSHITFDGLKIASSVSTGATFDAAIENGSGYLTVRRCEITGVNTGVHNWQGFYYVGFDHVHVLDCYIHDILGAASGQGYGVYSVAQYTVVAGCRFVNVGRHDCYFSGSDIGANYSRAVNNSSVGNGVQSMAVYNTNTYPPITGVIIANNTIKDCAIGIRFDVNSARCVAIGNHIDNASSVPLQLDGGVAVNEQPQGNIFANNVVTNCQAAEMILITNASRTIVCGNNLESNGKLYGIFILPSGAPAEYPTGTQIFGNTIRGQTSHAIFVDAGAVDTVIGPNYYGAATVSISNDRDYIVDTSVVTPRTINLTGKGGGAPIFLEIANGATPISLTDFTGCRKGQVLHIAFPDSGAVTITLANAFLGGGVPFVSTQFDTITLILRETGWWELCRSVN